MSGYRIRLLCAVALALSLAAVAYGVWRFNTSHSADPIPDSAFAAPNGLRVVDDVGGCGSGGDAECSRTWTVESAEGAVASDVTATVVDYLERERGWQLSVGPRGSRGCRDDGHECVDVVAAADANQVQVTFTDCCGDPWPFD